MSKLRVSEIRTEHLLTELLRAQGWDCRRPPNGELLRQHEYKDHSHLRDVFLRRSKTGMTGRGLPEAVIVEKSSLQPLIVVEGKSSINELEKAAKEVTSVYGRACVEAGYTPLAVAVAGTEEDNFSVRVFKWDGAGWKTVTYEGHPISWIPNSFDTERLRASAALAELRPSVPRAEVLSGFADEINRLLRESNVNDRSRPSVVGACMLALWQSKGRLRKDPDHLLADINRACEQAFRNAGKPDLAKSLYVDEANAKLAVKSRRIITILERLNVSVLTAEHDYLGQLYETFFRYSGGNTIGQYFTPRHIADFCATLANVTREDITLDPTCGTGGFLISAMEHVLRNEKISRSEMVKMVHTRLFGFDDEPVTAALCVANMIFRGDGSSSIYRDDAFTAAQYPSNKATVVLMNPPYPHKKTDTPTERFINRGLEGLATGGRLIAVIPQSLLTKAGSIKAWREALLRKHTLEAVVQMPDHLFQPYASATTAVIYLRKGIPHPSKKHVFFARITQDGFRLKKGIKVTSDEDDLPRALEHFQSATGESGFSGWAGLDDEMSFAPGAYIPAREMTVAEMEGRTHDVIHARMAFTALHATELSRLASISSGIRPPLNTAFNLTDRTTIGSWFDIRYGQKALHSKEGLLPGSTLVISSSGLDNGCYGFFDFEPAMKPPFVSVPSTGSIGIAHVQEWPCGVTDDCLLLFPKKDTPHAMLYIAAAVIRNEKWRFSYGRKATPVRISGFPLMPTPELVERINEYLEQVFDVEKRILGIAEKTR